MSAVATADTRTPPLLLIDGEIRDSLAIRAQIVDDVAALWADFERHGARIDELLDLRAAEQGRAG